MRRNEKDLLAKREALDFEDALQKAHQHRVANFHEIKRYLFSTHPHTHLRTPLPSSKHRREKADMEQRRIGLAEYEESRHEPNFNFNPHPNLNTRNCGKKSKPRCQRNGTTAGIFTHMCRQECISGERRTQRPWS